VRKPEIARQQRANDRKKMIAALQKKNDPLWQGYSYAAAMAEAASRVARLKRGNLPGDYPLLSGGDINLYGLFVERAARLINPKGMVGLLVPSGIAADLGASAFFKSVATTGRLAALLDFENKKVFFPDVHASFKFCAFAFGGKERKFSYTECAFFLHKMDELKDDERSFQLTAKDFAVVNPNTGTAPIFRTQRDAELTRKIYNSFPVLVRHEPDPLNPQKVIEHKLYPVKYYRMFDMTNDAHLFKKRDELEADGFYPVAGNRLKKGKEEFMPLYEGKMVQIYNHRAANIIINPDNVKRPAQEEPAITEQLNDSNWLPKPQFMVDVEKIEKSARYEWCVGFKHVTATTNVRTMIACVLPFCAVGNSLPLMLADNTSRGSYSDWAYLMLANLNSFAFDFSARQKVQGQNFNWFILEQLPMIDPKTYHLTRFGKKSAADIIKDEVLHLCYTANDLEPFARDMGYQGEPVKWDEEDRRHRMARLDAIYFLLYGLSRDEADYILGTFPIVARHDQEDHGRYLTRDLILAYMAAFTAGDTEARIAVR